VDGRRDGGEEGLFLFVRPPFEEVDLYEWHGVLLSPSF
jgi:hypothetical protein